MRLTASLQPNVLMSFPIAFVLSFCLQEKLGKLVSFSFTIVVFQLLLLLSLFLSDLQKPPPPPSYSQTSSNTHQQMTLLILIVPRSCICFLLKRRRRKTWMIIPTTIISFSREASPLPPLENLVSWIAPTTPPPLNEAFGPFSTYQNTLILQCVRSDRTAILRSCKRSYNPTVFTILL